MVREFAVAFVQPPGHHHRRVAAQGALVQRRAVGDEPLHAAGRPGDDRAGAAQVVRGGVEDYPAVIDDQDAVEQVGRLVDQVSGQHDVRGCSA